MFSEVSPKAAPTPATLPVGPYHHFKRPVQETRAERHSPQAIRQWFQRNSAVFSRLQRMSAI